MSLTREKLLSYLKSSTVEQDPGIPYDPEYGNLSDEDLEEILEFMLVKLSPADTLDSVPEGQEYILILLAKKEIYYRLSTKTAPLYPIDVNGIKIDRDKRFDHYFSLVQKVDAEYKLEISTGKHTFIDVGELYIDSRYFSKRNYDKASIPFVSLFIDKEYEDRVEISWTKFNVNRGKFHAYTLYVSEGEIIDRYKVNYAIHKYEILAGAKAIQTFYNIHSNCYRIEGLLPNTPYKVAIVVKDRNGIEGYSEIEVRTLLVEVVEVVE